ncbi:hypothetical protein HYDPIDRAFT_100297, partial [Hydnomerulius pinastri MD-312]
MQKIIKTFFRYVMLSHKWEGQEPLLEDVLNKSVYGLKEPSTISKLQNLCTTARDAGYRWVWSDTCCIDKKDLVVLQQSLTSMYHWYSSSALTIVYLSDVPSPSQSGMLAHSIWNTRGWTLQEFLASSTVRFYDQQWTPYLNSSENSANHKESVAVMAELETVTGISAEALLAFHPGPSAIREKLRLASSRTTTREEDVAYSLFGIFDVWVPPNYGEGNKALGRLLQEVVGRSGDPGPLAW